MESLIPSRGPGLNAFIIVFLVLCTISLVLRFWSRALLGSDKRFQTDDWFALLAWVSMLLLAR